jgi:membrane protease YdiL (CAAX protease family)
LIERKFAKAEIAIVLLLSLGASAIYSVLSLIHTLTTKAGFSSATSKLNPQESNAEVWDFIYRFIGIALGFVPVVLALYLLAQKYPSPIKLLGLSKPTAKDLRHALTLFACIGIPGIGLYLLARSLGLAARIIPGEFQYWWLIPILLLSAFKAAATEEIIMIGYLYKKFDELGFSFRNQQLISASIRAAYHAYQGVAGIVGNFVMGLVFGWAYRRWGRVAPLLIAHFLLDAFSFVGYALLAKQLATFSGLF